MKLADKALKVLDQRGWYKGDFEGPAVGANGEELPPNHGPVCILGAVGVANGSTPEDGYEQKGAQTLVRKIGRILKKQGKICYETEPGDDPRYTYDAISEAIMGWNDTKGTEEEVRAVLEEAAK